MFSTGKPATHSALTGHLACFDAPAEVQYRAPYGSTPCFAVVMLPGISEAPAKLHQLLGKLKSAGLSVRGNVCGKVPSVLVREVAADESGPVPGQDFLSAALDIAQLAPSSYWHRHAAYEGRACVAITLPKSDTPRADLDSLHRKLMYAGHTCISKTHESTPSILVVAS